MDSKRENIGEVSHRGSIGQQYTGSYQRSHHTPGHVYGIDEPRITMSTLQRRDEDICVCVVKCLSALLWQRTSINVHQSVVWRNQPSGKRIRFQIRPRNASRSFTHCATSPSLFLNSCKVNRLACMFAIFTTALKSAKDRRSSKFRW